MSTTAITGVALGSLASLFLFVDAGMKVVKSPIAVKATVALGYPESVVLPIGVVLLLCPVLYLVPRTAVLGAILLTGYLGGAIATNVRAAVPLFNVLFPILVALFLWGSLFLREPRLRALIPFRTQAAPERD